MQTGDILLVRTSGFWGAVGRWLNHSPVNAVALALDDTHIVEAGFGTGPRIVTNPYRSYTYGRLKRPLTPEEQAMIQRIARSAAERRHRCSLLKALLIRLLGPRTEWLRGLPCWWVCNEVIDYAYLVAGIVLIPERVLDISVEDLLASDQLVFAEVRGDEA